MLERLGRSVSIAVRQSRVDGLFDRWQFPPEPGQSIGMTWALTTEMEIREESITFVTMLRVIDPGDFLAQGEPTNLRLDEKHVLLV